MTFRLLLVIAAGVTACSSKHDVCEPPTAQLSPTSELCMTAAPSFSAEIAPILARRCNDSCHSPTIDGGPWPLDTRQNVSDWSPLLVKDLQNCTMPPAGAPFPVEERDKLWAWLSCGAPDN